MAVRLSVGRIVCDFLVLFAIAIPLLIFHEWVKPYKRGFYCDDESIRYPYRPSTVTRQALIVIGILIPTLLILFTELFRTLTWERKEAHLFRTYEYRDKNVHRFIVRLYTFIGYFFVGVCFNQLMVDIAKYTIGRQRPHFMDVCRPNVGYSNCDTHMREYITEFQCTGTDQYLIHESQLSFYSGHSAFSFYAAWYTSFYLQARLYRPLISRLVLPVIQFSLFAGAAYVAYTRISDYKHHWSDVLVGMFMGSAIGIINAIFIANVFARREIPAGIKTGRHYQMDSPTHHVAFNGDAERGGVTVHIQDNVAGPHTVIQKEVQVPQQVRYSTLVRGDAN
uniref:AcidPPc domain-containing protein n=2 Tax=Bursaphelenchus xylophilus TaxID=6326 RepID=A0A1I7RW64_BURXY